MNKPRKKPGPKPKDPSLEQAKESEGQGKLGQAQIYQNDAFKKDQIRLAQNSPVVAPDKDY